MHGARRPGREQADFWMVVEPPYIAGFGFGAPPEGAYTRTVDARGALLLPGAIDCHVHFREPGMTRKATIAYESRAAVAGGVTSYLEMPNTSPATTTIPLWREKCEIARRDSLANYAFFIGATSDNLNVLLNADYTAIPGVKLFLGQTTGSMQVTEGVLNNIFRQVRALIAVHAEDNERIAENTAEIRARFGEDVPVEYHTRIRDSLACFRATEKAVQLARYYGTRLHICHLSTAAELALLPRPEDYIPADNKLITSEVSPHHLLFTAADYGRLGARIKMNPSVKLMRDRIALRHALQNGIIDMVATDHAPHLLSEKEGGALRALSGAPAVQFALPALIDLFGAETAERVYCSRPAAVYRIERRGEIREGYYADFTLVEETAPRAVSDADVVSLCGWTPMAGLNLRHSINSTWVNGHEVYRARQDGAPAVFASPGAAMPLRFAKR